MPQPSPRGNFVCVKLRNAKSPSIRAISAYTVKLMFAVLVGRNHRLKI
jgi:hypothetical protein